MLCVDLLNRLKLQHDLPPQGIETPHDTEAWGSVSGNSDGKVLGIVIPPSDQIKKNSFKDNLRSEIVGGYRHKRYERCYHGILGFVLLERLNEGREISFLRKNRAGQTSQYSIINK